MTASAATQLTGFLADLMFVGCLFGVLLYGLWVSLKRPTLVQLGRLSLLVVFGSAVTLFALGQNAGLGFSYASFFLFVLVALFLLLEFLFQMSVLGLLVSALGTVIASLRYWPLPPLHRIMPANAVVGYWWVLRDLAVTTGAAVMSLGLCTALLLYVSHNRRPGDLVHPNDLRDVAAILSRAAVPLFLFGAFASGVALAHMKPDAFEVWGFACLVVLCFTSVAWWLLASTRRFVGKRVLLLVALNSLALLAYAVGGLLRMGLTPGAPIP